MARTYKRKLGSRHYRNYTAAQLDNAVREFRAGVASRKVAEKYGIPYKTIQNKAKGRHAGATGHPPIFTSAQEDTMVKLIQVCGEWSCPLSTIDIRMIAKRILDTEGRTVHLFKDNLPGPDWVSSFLLRHKNQLTLRQAQNIKSARAEKTADEISIFFDNLTQSLSNVPPSNIINYDETNLSDDPGRVKVVFKRGVKYPERIINHTKSCTSIMFAGTPDGVILPPYVVYKAEHMWDTWCNGGPDGTRYNRSKSGWFDSTCFNDWFQFVVVPFCRGLVGPKVLIGDNLSSHLNPEIVAACELNNIRFVFLPQNSTHLTQPLDVCFFRPLKMKWREILTKWKSENKGKTTLPKDSFAPLLKQLCEEIKLKNNPNISSGFRATGICPLDRHRVLAKLPDSAQRLGSASEVVNEAVLSHLRTLRGPDVKITTRRKKVNVQPGKSVCSSDFPQSSSSTGPLAKPGPLVKRRRKKDTDTGTSSESEELEPETTDEDEVEDKEDDAGDEIELQSDGEQASDKHSSMPVKLGSIKVGEWISVKFTERLCVTWLSDHLSCVHYTTQRSSWNYLFLIGQQIPAHGWVQHCAGE